MTRKKFYTTISTIPLVFTVLLWIGIHFFIPGYQIIAANKMIAAKGIRGSLSIYVTDSSSKRWSFDLIPRHQRYDDDMGYGPVEASPSILETVRGDFYVTRYSRPPLGRVLGFLIPLWALFLIAALFPIASSIFLKRKRQNTLFRGLGKRRDRVTQDSTQS